MGSQPSVPHGKPSAIDWAMAFAGANLDVRRETSLTRAIISLADDPDRPLTQELVRRLKHVLPRQGRDLYLRAAPQKRPIAPDILVVSRIDKSVMSVWEMKIDAKVNEQNAIELNQIVAYADAVHRQHYLPDDVDRFDANCTFVWCSLPGRSAEEEAMRMLELGEYISTAGPEHWSLWKTLPFRKLLKYLEDSGSASALTEDEVTRLNIVCGWLRVLIADPGYRLPLDGTNRAGTQPLMDWLKRQPTNYPGRRLLDR